MLELDVDSLDLLNALDEEGAEYLLVGAHALAVHGIVRATSDVDLLVRPTGPNSHRVFVALTQFGAPVLSHGVDDAYFAVEGRVYQLGLPPRRIDIMSSISGVSADEAFSSAVTVEIAGSKRLVLSSEALLKNKRATGRAKDLADVVRLEALRHPRR